MLTLEKSLFFAVPEKGRERVLHPATIVSINDDIHTATLERGDLSLEEEQEVLVYYEIERQFLMQPARIEAVTMGDPNPSIGFVLCGDPVSADQRECYRVPTAFKMLTAAIGPEASCPLVDVSETGFAAIASKTYAIGSQVDVTLRFESKEFTGRAVVASIDAVAEGEGRRYGFYCAGKLSKSDILARGLRAISLAVQREHLQSGRADA